MKLITIPLFFVMSSVAYSNPISIKIDTDFNVSDIYTAKIRLQQGNEWTYLGEINSGRNVFDLDTSVDGNVGSLWIEKSANEKWVAHFDKSEDTKSLNFVVENELLLSKTGLKKESDDKNKLPKMKFIKEDSGFNDSSSSEMIKLYKLSPDAKNTWPANCNYFDWIFGSNVFCSVAANPGFVFESTNTTGGSILPEYGLYGGNYESTRSASDVKQSGGAYFDILAYGVYAHANFYWGNGQYDIFDGGGVGIGAIKGKGIFY